MTFKKTPEAAPPAPGPHNLPQSGGSYIALPDGSLVPETPPGAAVEKES